MSDGRAPSLERMLGKLQNKGDMKQRFKNYLAYTYQVTRVRETIYWSRDDVQTANTRRDDIRKARGVSFRTGGGKPSIRRILISREETHSLSAVSVEISQGHALGSAMRVLQCVWE